jgi:hypothetical protein
LYIVFCILSLLDLPSLLVLVDTLIIFADSKKNMVSYVLKRVIIIILLKLKLSRLNLNSFSLKVANDSRP